MMILISIVKRTKKEEPKGLYEDMFYHPKKHSHPGITLLHLLDERKITPEQLAKKCKLSIKTIQEILAGRAIINLEIATQLEKALDVPAEFWIQREANYRQ